MSNIFYPYNDYKYGQFQLKHPSTKIINNETYIFVPLRYKKKEIFIQSPRLIAPFGLNNYNHNYSCVLSLDDMDIDPNINNFYQFIRKCEDLCSTEIKKNLDVWANSSFHFEQMKLCSVIKSVGEDETPFFKLKILNYLTELYNEKDELQPPCNIEKLIIKKCEIISMIELSNIWFSQKCFGITWKTRQIKIYPPNELISGVSLLDDDLLSLSSTLTPSPTPPPPPPPLPPPPPPLPPLPSTLITVKCDGLSTITLKNSHQNKVSNECKQFEISLTDIMNVKKHLRSNSANISMIENQNTSESVK